VSTTTLPPAAIRTGAGARAGARLRALARGRTDDPRWVRPALGAVLAVAAALCLWA